MSIVRTLRENVERGAELLDERVPEWFLRVEPAKVEIASACNCVLGHLFEDYGTGVMALDIECRGAEYGFTSVFIPGLEFGITMQFETLDALWRDKIASRRTAWLVEHARKEEVLTA